MLADARRSPVPSAGLRPTPLRARVPARAREVLLSATSWRYGLRLALCLGLAQALVSTVTVPRSYWVPLTVTFVLKPDFGSVFTRAVLRALGTAVGLVLATAVLEVVPRGAWEVPVVAVLAAALPVVSRRSYGLQTMVITPLILILSDLLNHQGVHLLVPRLVDSLLGCAIVLVAGYALWPESWHSRVGARLADSVDDVARYLECAFAGWAATVTRPGRRRVRWARWARRVRGIGCDVGSTAIWAVCAPSSSVPWANRRRRAPGPPPGGRCWWRWNG